MKTYLSYFGTIVGVLFGSYFGIVGDLVGFIICAVLVLFCMLWFSLSWEQMKKQSKDKERRIKKLEKWKKEHEEYHLEWLKEIPTEKPKLGTIRTGSYPSELYYKMLIEKENANAENREATDNRGANQTATQK